MIYDLLSEFLDNFDGTDSELKSIILNTPEEIEPKLKSWQLLKLQDYVDNEIVSESKENKMKGTQFERRLRRLEKSITEDYKQELEYYVSTKDSAKRWSSDKRDASISSNLEFILRLQKKYKNSWVQGKIGPTGYIDELWLVRNKNGYVTRIPKVSFSNFSFPSFSENLTHELSVLSGLSEELVTLRLQKDIDLIFEKLKLMDGIDWVN